MAKLDTNQRHALWGWRPQGDLAGYTFYTTRRGATIFYPQAPPKDPPSAIQKIYRDRIRAAAKTWQALPPAQRVAYERATKKLALRITGYNLWCYVSLTRDTAALTTIATQSGLSLTPP
jgi:hypothetical protein